MAQTVQNCINAINIYESYSIIRSCTPITSVANTPKKIDHGGPLWDEFTYEYYNDNNDDYRQLFQQYTSSAVYNIIHTSTVI